MNLVTVKGGRAVEREVANKVLGFMLKKVLPRTRTLDITLTFKNLKGAMGYCMMGDNHKEFELEIQKGMDLRTLVATICHEMIHVKQYYRKEMNDELTMTGRAKWKGRTVKPDTDYIDLPWEKEAFKYEYKYADMIWEENIL